MNRPFHNFTHHACLRARERLGFDTDREFMAWTRRNVFNPIKRRDVRGSGLCFCSEDAELYSSCSPTGCVAVFVVKNETLITVITLTNLVSDEPVSAIRRAAKKLRKRKTRERARYT